MSWNLGTAFFALALLVTAVNIAVAIRTMMTPKFSSGIHFAPSILAFLGWFVSSRANRNLMIAIIAIDLITYFVVSSQIKNKPRG